jgi:hypothetical protein
MIQTSSNAKAFFSDLFIDPAQSFQKLNELVSSGGEENEWMEFKGAYETTHTEGSGKDKKWEELKNNWSKAIGAFANSSGGVMIWGIDAPNKFAKSFSFAKDANQLAEKLSSLVSSAVIPLVHGIEIKAVKNDLSSSGLVVCLIPASRYAPHQSNWPRRQFYMRCQDGSHECGYMELKRLFQPQIGPTLAPRIRIEASLNPNYNWSIGGEITIKNIGTASANGLLFSFHGPGDPTGQALEWEKASGSKTLILKKPLHPTQEVSLRLMPFQEASRSRPDDFFFEFKTTMYATDSKPFIHTFKLMWNQFLATGDSNNICRLTMDGDSLEGA